MAKLNRSSPTKRPKTDPSPEALSRVLRNASDIVIELGADLTIESAAVNAASRSIGPLDHWHGLQIDDVLTEESRPKLAERLETLAANDGAVETVELNHRDKNDWEFPVRYTVQSLGVGKGTILVGHDLRTVAEAQQQLVKAQLALEKEYEKHRDYETRYRVLRDTLSDAMMFVDAATGRILDINPLAAKLIDMPSETLIGSSVNTIFSTGKRGPALDGLVRAASETNADPMIVNTSDSRVPVTVRPLLFRSAGDMILLCRLSTTAEAEPATEDLLVSLASLFQRSTDAIVFTDFRGAIRQANEGFLVLCDVVQASDLKGQTLADYLFRGTIDQKVLLENASQIGRLRTFSTRLRSAYGNEIAVEVSAAHLSEGPDATFGFIIRDRSRADATVDTTNRDEAMSNAMDLVGTAPLKELVAATADVVEKMCIETAVKLTDNNRVAAAELLGLSRQSFYVRLRKYGLLKKDEDQ